MFHSVELTWSGMDFPNTIVSAGVGVRVARRAELARLWPHLSSTGAAYLAVRRAESDLFIRVLEMFLILTLNDKKKLKSF